MVDTSILIDFYRKTDKETTAWVALVRKQYRFAISAITKYEIYSGATDSQILFWNAVLNSVNVIPLDETVIDTAVEINRLLKRKRKQIDLADLFIASTAVTHKLLFATLNKKHFDRVDKFEIIE